jgi:hypothetical protein
MTLGHCPKGCHETLDQPPSDGSKAPSVTLASLFYPTNYPTSRHPKIGLVAGERAVLANAANRFKLHEQYDNDHASLLIIGYANVRGVEDSLDTECWKWKC